MEKLEKEEKCRLRIIQQARKNLTRERDTKQKEMQDKLKRLTEEREEDAKKIAKLVEKKKCLEEEKKIIDAKFAEMDTEILSFSPMDEEAYAAKKEQIEKEWSIVSATHYSAVKRNVREYLNCQEEMIEKQEVIKQKIKELKEVGQREEEQREEAERERRHREKEQREEAERERRQREKEQREEAERERRHREKEQREEAERERRHREKEQRGEDGSERGQSEKGQRGEDRSERRLREEALAQKRKAQEMTGSDDDFRDVQSKNIKVDEDTTVEDREEPVAGDVDGDGLDVERSTFPTVVRVKSPKHLYAAADAVDQGQIL